MTDAPQSQTDVRPPTANLRELALVFLKLGTTAFGGPAAHVAMMEEEMVRRRGWLSRERFLDLMAASNLIPGPTSTEVAIHVGYLQCGWLGLIVGGACFILPAMLMVGAIAWAYKACGSVPQVMGVLYGVKPVVIAIIVQALVRLGRTAVKGPALAALLVASIVLSVAGLPPIAVMLWGGAAAVIGQRIAERRRKKPIAPFLWGPIAQASVGSAGAGAAGVTLGTLFLVFLKFGAVVFGSGYVLLAFLREDLVTRLHWLTEAQLIDATAVGQVTPGPVFTTATFVGYLVAGWQGAIVATVGIFLPAFILVAMSGPLIPRLRKSPLAAAFLDGCNVAAIGLMAVVSCQLAQAALVGPLTIAIAAVCAIVLVVWKINSTWLIAAGAIIGLIAAR